MAKLVGRPDRAFYRKRRILRRGGFPESKTRRFTRNDRSGRSEKDRPTADGRINAETATIVRDLTIDRIDKFLRFRLLHKESGR